MDDEEQVDQKQPSVGSEVGDALKKQAGKQVNKQAKKAVAQIEKKVAANSSLMAALAPILFYAAIIIIAIIFVVGIVMFVNMMPGMVMQKLKEAWQNLKNGWDTFWGADTTTFVNDDEINGVLNYLDSMGYDLFGYGFLTGLANKSSREGETYSNGVNRDENGKITEALSDYIKTYIVSDNYVYTMKNDNKGGSTWWGEALVMNGANLFGYNNADWGKGLIRVSYEGKVGNEYKIGVKGDDVNSVSFDSIKIDRENKKLTIQKGWWKDYYTYNLDGWTGRYGMPLEFLLSVHLATLMPDLAYEMATSFDTDILILLHGTSDKTTAGYRQEWIPKDETVIRDDITYKDFKNGKDGNGRPYIDEGFITREGFLYALNINDYGLIKTSANTQYATLFKLGISSPDTCSNIQDPDVLPIAITNANYHVGSGYDAHTASYNIGNNLANEMRDGGNYILGCNGFYDQALYYIFKENEDYESGTDDIQTCWTTGIRNHISDFFRNSKDVTDNDLNDLHLNYFNDNSQNDDFIKTILVPCDQNGFPKYNGQTDEKILNKITRANENEFNDINNALKYGNYNVINSEERLSNSEYYYSSNFRIF